MAVNDPMYRYAMQTFEADGVRTQYEISFDGGYIRQADVVAYSEAVDPETGLNYDYTPHTLTFLSESVDPLTEWKVATVEIAPAVADGRILTIRRDTAKAAPIVNYESGSILTEKNLDLSNRQNVFAVAEIHDRLGETSQLARIAYDAVQVASGDWGNLSTLMTKQEMASSAGASLIGYGAPSGQRLSGWLEAFIDLKDYATLSDAFAASAALNKRLRVPQGTYSMDGLTYDGPGMFSDGGAVFVAEAGTGGTMLTVTSLARFDNIVFDGNASNKAGSPLGIVVDSGAPAVFTNCSFTNFRYKVLILEDAPGSRVLGCRLYDTGTIGNCNGIEVKCSGCVLIGNVFDGFGDGHCVRTGYFPEDAVRDIHDTTIMGNYFHDTEHVGVTCELGTRRCTIMGNTFHALEAGIKTDNVICSDITITGNTFAYLTNNVGTAFNLTAPRTVFANNTIVGCLSGPIVAGGVVSGNTFVDCGTAGGYLINCTSGGLENTIINNWLSNITGSGIRAADYSSVTGNRIDGTTDYAIRIDGPGGRVSHNVIANSAVGVRANSNATDWIVKDNTFKSTVALPISNVSSTPLTIAVLDNIGLPSANRAVTIAAGAVAVGSYDGPVQVDTEGAASADDLETITGGRIGQVLVLRNTSSARAVTVKSNTASIRLYSDCLLDSVTKTLSVMWTGSVWAEVGRSHPAPQVRSVAGNTNVNGNDAIVISSGSGATISLPASVAVGTIVTIVALAACTVAASGGATLYRSGTSGSAALVANSQITVVKVNSNTWIG